MKILSEKEIVKDSTGKFQQCEAYLVRERGGKIVVYIGKSGEEVRREIFSKSRFKNIDIKAFED